MIDTRTSGDGIRRRRACLQCGHRFTTHERIEVKTPLVVKKDGRREPFDRDQVVGGLSTACRKRPVSADQIDDAASRVEQDVAALGGAEVPASAVGRLVLNELRDLDLVAYVRFASVYLEVQSASEFMDLLQPFLGHPPAPDGESA